MIQTEPGPLLPSSGKCLLGGTSKARAPLNHCECESVTVLQLIFVVFIK